MAQSTIYVSQCGASFFCTAERDDTLGFRDELTVVYPFEHVADWNIVAAKRARAWFVRHCKRHGIKPIFD